MSAEERASEQSFNRYTKGGEGGLTSKALGKEGGLGESHLVMSNDEVGRSQSMNDKLVRGDVGVKGDREREGGQGKRTDFCIGGGFMRGVRA